jgi:glycerol kinase
VGFWRDREELARRWQLERRFECRMDGAIREKLYSGWKRAVARAMDWAADE